MLLLYFAVPCGFAYIAVQTQSARSCRACGFATAFTGLLVSYLFPYHLCTIPPDFSYSFIPLLPLPSPSTVSAQIYLAFRLRGEIDQAGAYAFRGVNK